MGILSKRRVGGAILLTSAAVLGKETVLWAWNKILDLVSTGAGGMTLTAFSWQNAIASFLAVIGAVLVLWPGTRQPKPNPYGTLWTRADNIVARIRNQRRTRWIQISHGEPLTDVVRDGVSTLMLFEKQGFAAPNFQTNSAERIAVGLECYFSAMIPLLRDGHIPLALAQAKAISERAIVEAAALNMEEWSHDRLGF